MIPHDPDPQIDRTLRALAQAEPAPDFASRLEARLQAQLEAQLHAGERRRRTVPSRFLSALAAAGRSLTPALGASLLLLAALLGGAMALRHRHALRPSALYPNRAASSPVGSTPGGEGHNSYTQRVQVASAPAPIPAGPVAAPPARRPSLPGARENTSPAASPRTPGSDLDAQALADLRTPSFPAPPLPPTVQEQLVHRMLRRGGERELAHLDPAAVAQAIAQEQASFHAFFEPPSDPEAGNQPRSLAEIRLPSSTQPKLQGEPHP